MIIIMYQADKYKFRLFFAMMVVGVMVFYRASGQSGKVIINEINNSSNGCDFGAHYIELINLGPGTQDISCYKIVTNNYTITIPNNAAAVLKPGGIYLIAGTSQLTGCGSNSAPAVNVNLNWNSSSSCPNCITPSAPALNAFFSASNGTDSYPITLYDPSFILIDAVRDQGSNLITGSTRANSIPTGSSCTSQNIPLPTDPNAYEVPNPTSTGGNSSFARAGDGSCTWVKASANTTPGQPNSASSSYSLVSATSSLTPLCNSTTNANMAITVTATTSPYQYSYVYATDANFTQNVTTSLVTQSSSANFTLTPVQPGYYSFLFSIPNTSCGDSRLQVTANNPTVNLAASSTPNCPTNNPAPNGSATITISNPTSSTPSSYYPLTYSVINTATNQAYSGSPATPTSTSPILISSLPNASYRITVTPNYGCQKTQDFTIAQSCVVPMKLINFTAANAQSNNKFEITIDADEELKDLILESSSNAKSFVKIADIPFENRKGDQKITFEIPTTTDEFFRLVMIDIFGNRINSEIIRIKNNTQSLGIKVFPNPFQDDISLEHFTKNDDLLIACVLSVNGAVIKEQNFKLTPGVNKLKLSTAGLSKGSYILSLKKTSSPHIQYSNIIKQ